MEHQSSLFGRASVLAIALALSAGCGGRTPTSPTPAPGTCAFTITPSTVVVPAAGQAVTVHIDTTAACAWTARSDANWIVLSATSGSGPADVTVTAATNTLTTERSATATIAGKDFSLRQSGRDTTSCSYTLTSPSSTFGADGGRGRLSLQTAAGCAWTARSLAAWITMLTTAGTGPAEIEYSVAAFDGDSQRETSIVVEQASFPVRQDPPAPIACQYSVEPTSLDLHWHGTPGDGFDVRLTTGSRCSWTAAAGAPWIELLTAASGTGPATLRIRVGSHTAEATRTSPLMIRWPTDTAGQNVWLTQEGCRYALGPSSQAVSAAGGVQRASVFGDPVSTSCAIGCPWEAKTNASWIHFSGTGRGSGDDQLTYTVDPNTTGVPRSGTITLEGWTLTVNQAG
jgi:Putative binding domain, N-terminal/Viral BACON domain